MVQIALKIGDLVWQVRIYYFVYRLLFFNPIYALTPWTWSKRCQYNEAYKRNKKIFDLIMGQVEQKRPYHIISCIWPKKMRWCQNKIWHVHRGFWSWWMSSLDDDCHLLVVTCLFLGTPASAWDQRGATYLNENSTPNEWSPPTKDCHLPQREFINFKNLHRNVSIYFYYRLVFLRLYNFSNMKATKMVLIWLKRKDPLVRFEYRNA